MKIPTVFREREKKRNKQDKIFVLTKFWTPKVGDILETYRIYICICCLPMPILKTAEFTK